MYMVQEHVQNMYSTWQQAMQYCPYFSSACCQQGIDGMVWVASHTQHHAAAVIQPNFVHAELNMRRAFLSSR